MLKKTQLYDRHLSLGAHMSAFAGFDMPVRYQGIRAEHMAVREAAGLFDVSHMGQIFVMGDEAGALVQHLVTNDVSKLKDGQALYTLMCNHDGGILDDLLVYRLRDYAYMLVVNAANTKEDLAWMQANNEREAMLHDTSEHIALLALQGPRSLDIMARLTDIPVHDIPLYHFVRPAPGAFFGCEKAIVARTGYTGEIGLEIYVEREAAGRLWDAIMQVRTPLGLLPAGLGARDTLRLEAGYCLYGNEIDQNTHPFEARLGWITKLNKGPFIGRDALHAIEQQPRDRLLCGLIMNGRGIPRRSCRVFDTTGKPLGHVTSGTHSPVLRKGIALAYIERRDGLTRPGAQVMVDVRGRAHPATVVRPPLHKQPKVQ